ncbi:MAG: hypothetical protein VX341_12260 [Bdellovibrionota bacterium]|nr:hypothetical protein [Bdellovibrionota bacterium]
MDEQSYLSGLLLLTGFAIFYYGSRSFAEGIQLLTSKVIKSFVLNKKNNYAIIDFLNGAKLSLISFSPAMSSMVTLGLSNAKLLKEGRSLNMFSGIVFGFFLMTTVIGYYWLELSYLLMSLGFLIRTFIPGNIFRNAGKVSMGLGLIYLALTFMERAFSDVYAESILQNFLTLSLNVSTITSVFVYLLIGLCLTLIFLRANLIIAFAVAISHYTFLIDIQLCALVTGCILGVFILSMMASKNDASHRSLAEIKTIIVSLILGAGLAMSGLIYFADILQANYKGITFILFYIFNFSFFSFFIQLISHKFLLNVFYRPDKEEYSYEQSRLKYLGEGRMMNPSMAFVMVEMELVKLFDIVDRMFMRCRDYVDSDEKRARSLAKIKDYERIIDNIQHEIDVFIEKSISTGIGEEDSKISMKYLKLASSMEKLADSLDKLATILTRFYEMWELSESEKDKLLLFYEEIYELYKHSYYIFIGEKNEDEDLEPTIERMLSLKNTLFNARTEFSKAHESEPDLMKIYYSDMMIALASMRGQARDIYKRCHS